MFEIVQSKLMNLTGCRAVEPVPELPASSIDEDDDVRVLSYLENFLA